MAGVRGASGGKRGRQQRGRSGVFNPNGVARANVIFQPGEPLRTKYEAAVHGMKVSGAEVLRYALEQLELDEHGRPVGWPIQEQEEIATAS